MVADRRQRRLGKGSNRRKRIALCKSGAIWSDIDRERVFIFIFFLMLSEGENGLHFSKVEVIFHLLALSFDPEIILHLVAFYGYIKYH